MNVTLHLPRVLTDVVGCPSVHTLEGGDVASVIADLLDREPGLRSHIVQENGDIRPHVSVFVDGDLADMRTEVREGSQVRILNAVSGGSVRMES